MVAAARTAKTVLKATILNEKVEVYEDTLKDGKQQRYFEKTCEKTLECE